MLVWELLYAAVLLAAIVWYVRRRGARQLAHAEELRATLEAGLAEPPSLHPVVDPIRCIGSGSCISACPEGALGMIGGKATLVNGSACIGHGACRPACPVEAIRLVFGTEKRGIDIPNVTPEFESNVSGIFIAGELGGMGLIRKAAEQGRQSIDAIRRRARGSHDHDVVIVGCGPAGLSAGLSAIEHKLRYRLIEQEDSLGGSVYHYPRNKIAMTAPVKLALIGNVKFGEVQKETLLEFWLGVVKKTGLKVHFRECMENVVADGDGFIVTTNSGTHRTRSVLLSMGRRGTPRKLGVPGEESPKVVYRLIDAEQYRGQAVLVVGGGDSALEAALALAEQPGTKVAISYRGDAFSRVKQKNREWIEAASSAGRIKILLGTTVHHIEDDRVVMNVGTGTESLRNEAVIVCAGGQLPTPLLQKIGIQFETRHGSR